MLEEKFLTDEEQNTFQRSLERATMEQERECGHRGNHENHDTLERPESSEIAANRSPPSTGLAHSTYVQVTTRSATFTALFSPTDAKKRQDPLVFRPNSSTFDDFEIFVVSKRY